MLERLTRDQQSFYKEFSQFSERNVKPFAGIWDRNQSVPRDIIDGCSEVGYVGGIFPKEYGGGGWDAVTFGLLNEVIGAASPSLCGLFTV